MAVSDVGGGYCGGERPPINTLLYPGALLPLGVAGVDEVRVEEVLGVGTFAVVCRVTCERTGTAYALKVLRDIEVEDSETREIGLIERIRREAAVSIPSRHVIRALGLCEWDARTFLILFEFFSGRPLHKLIAFGPDGLGDAERHAIFEQMLVGVGDAHRANVIHRDLKPENILVNERGEVRVIDFGLARFGDQRITVAGARFGTPHYMAPEVIQHGARRADARSDIYALGHILYELAMHEHYWARRGWGLMDFYKFLHSKPGPAVAADLSDFECSFFPETGRAVAERMLAVDPDDRYATVAEVMADLGLDGVVELESPTAPLPVPSEGAGVPSRPSRLVLLVEAGANGGARAELSLSPGESRVLGRGDFAAGFEAADLSVSRRHLEVRRAEGGGTYLIRDAGSRNGTLVNGVRLSGEGWMALSDGDHVRAGDLFLRAALAPTD